MQFQSSLNIIGLATTAIAACLMFLFPRVVSASADAGERGVGRVRATSGTDRMASGRRRHLSKFAIALFCVGFLLQLLAALPGSQPVEPPAPEDVAATTTPPACCESAANAEECADILARAGKNPYAAYGLIGRAPRYGHRSPTPAAAARIEPAGSDISAGDIPAQREAPALPAFAVPSGFIVHPAGDTPFQQFGLAVVYGLVDVLRKHSDTRWTLFEYRIGIYDSVVRATYGADPIRQPIDATDLSRSASFVCGLADKRPMTQLGEWSVELRFVDWDTQVLDARPFTVRRSDCP